MALINTEKSIIVTLGTVGLFTGRTTNPEAQRVYTILLQDKTKGETELRADAAMKVLTAYDGRGKATMDWSKPGFPAVGFPNGVAVDSNNNLFIAEVLEIYKCVGLEDAVLGTEAATPDAVSQALLDGNWDKQACTTVKSGMSPELHHGWRYIAFSPVTGSMYIQVGAPCNICEVTPPYYGTPPGSPPFSELDTAYYGTIAKWDKGADGEIDFTG